MSLQNYTNKSDNTQVIHVIPNLEFGGAENHLATLAMAQSRAGYEVTLVCLLSLNEEYVNRLDNQIRVENFSQMSWLRKVFAMNHLVKNSSNSFLHAHLPLAEMFVGFFVLARKSSKVLTRHVVGNYSQRFKRNIFLTFSIFALSRFGRIIAISNAVKESLLKVERIRTERISVVHYGINKKDLIGRSMAQKVVTRSKDEPIRFICVARYERQKRISDLIEAFKIFSKDGEATLHLFGDGSLFSLLKEQIEVASLSQRVFLHNKTSKVIEEMLQSDVFVLPTAFEGFGLVYLEAVACGLPIITTNNDAAKEVLGPNNYMEYPIGDIEALAKCLTSIQKSQKRLTLELTNRYPEILQRYTVDRMILETEYVYRSLLR